MRESDQNEFMRTRVAATNDQNLRIAVEFLKRKRRVLVIGRVGNHAALGDG